jgi:pyruvate, orthophosphate dikinase
MQAYYFRSFLISAGRRGLLIQILHNYFRNPYLFGAEFDKSSAYGYFLIKQARVTILTMAESNDICRLDYLYGTLATAYKGVITSLAAKDFCITESDGRVTFIGIIVSMPQGDYEARLMHEGTELARTGLREGTFEFSVDTEQIRDAKNIQIDVVQQGRHIGTFLLKRERPDEFYGSAIELSADIRDLDARSLTALLSTRPGLLKRAEDIITMILSSKKDWPRLSEMINSFSRDLFWSDTKAFAAWFKTFVKWSIRACSTAPSGFSGRAASNMLSLIDIVLDNRKDIQDGDALADIWLSFAGEPGIDLSANLKKSVGVITRINDDLPNANIGPVIRGVLESLKKRSMQAPVLSDAVLDKLSSVIKEDDLAALRSYSEKSKTEIIAALETAEKLLAKREYSETLQNIVAAGSVLLDDEKMIDLVYSLLEKNANIMTTKTLAEATCGLFPVFSGLSAGAVRNALSGTARFIRKIIDLDAAESVESLLSEIEKNSIDIREYVLLNPEVASSIISSKDKGLVKHYKNILRHLYVPAPSITGFSGDTWAEMADPRHLATLSKFLVVLSIPGSEAELGEILLHLLCNLYVSGVFIPDDKLFQREVSAYLNSPALKDNFLFNYLLLKKLPVYFSEVGATNMIRDDTTEIDSWANDNVLYFLRKQVHVNSSNYNIRLIEQIISSWAYNDPGFLKEVVPADVLNAVNADILARYCSVMQPLLSSLKVLDYEGLHFQMLLSLSDRDIENGLSNATASDEIRRKILLICRIYRETVRKYALVSMDISRGDATPQLSEYLEHIKDLKETILSPEKTVPQESIFYKRHIAFGIPSVLGTYHETKLDAFGELYRTESRMTLLFEQIISEVASASADITGDYRIWIQCLDSMHGLSKVHAMENFQTDEVLTVLKTNELHISQVIDLLMVWQKELTWMVDSLTRQLHEPISEILKEFPEGATPEYLRNLAPGSNDYIDKASDIIIRNMLNSIGGFTEMDRLIEALIKKFHSGIEMGPDVRLSMTGNHPAMQKDFVALDELRVQDAMRLAPEIGGKAKNLVYLLNDKLPVPYSVVLPAIKAQDFREYTDHVRFMSDLKDAVQNIEARTGLIYGDSKKPLFLSARSGAYISMPGILSSILYCGMNEETRDAFAADTGDRWLAWDSYRRFMEHYATIVLGLDERILSDSLAGFMEQNDITRIVNFDSVGMERVVGLYQAELSERGLKIPHDVYDQLEESVKAVYQSWYGEKALQFRKALQVSERWGTAVLLMQMVSGNRKGSGVSVFFTRKPPALESGIYGETKEAATGDDLVYGRLINRPLAQAQASGGQESMETADPELFAMHQELAAKIEKAMGGLPQEVEATYVTDTDGKRMIYVLQTRRMEFHRGFIKHFRDICRMDSNIIGRGIGVHGGALSGIAAFSGAPEELEKLKKQTGLPVILLRKSSSTQDVSLMPHIDGIITSAGGATSHAAILAQKFGLTAVIGCPNMQIEVDKNGKPYAQIGNYMAIEGTVISIDGSTGLVYSRVCEFTKETKLP